MIKRLLTGTALAGFCGLTIFATASLAGPLLLGPINAPMHAPKLFTASVRHTTSQINLQLLNSYRQLRTFWLSRAVVR